MKILRDTYYNKITNTEKYIKSNLGLNLEDFINTKYAGNKLKNIFIQLIRNDVDADTVGILEQNLGDMKRYMDSRNPSEYACDLLLGWVLEDMVLQSFYDIGLECNLVSKDRQREFLKAPSSDIDLMLCLADKKILVEHVTDHTGYWLKNGKLHLRENKFEKLIQDNGILMGFDLFNYKFFIDQISNLQLIRKMDRHFLYGGKPASEISLEGIKFINLEDFKSSIQEYFGEEYGR